MTVLVVGATGTVGRQVATLLHQAGVPVRAGARSPDRARRLLPTGLPVARLDLAQPLTWSPALAGATGLFLLRPPQMTRVALLERFVQAAASAGVRHTVVLSVQGADRARLLPHRAVEQAVERSGMAFTHLRPAYFMDNLLTVHRAEIGDRAELFVPAGNGATALVDTADVAAAAVAAFTNDRHQGRAYDLTAEARTWNQIAHTLTSTLGRPIRYRRPGALRYALSSLRRGQPPAYVAVTLGLYTATRLRRAARLSEDLAQILDRPPRALAEFAAAHASAWQPDRLEAVRPEPGTAPARPRSPDPT